MTIKNIATTANPLVISSSIVSAFLATPGGVRCASLLGKSPKAAGKLLQSVYSWVYPNLPNVNPARAQPARMVCPKETWDGMTRNVKNCSGMCLSFLVDAGLLPLRKHVTPSGSGSKKYWLVS